MILLKSALLRELSFLVKRLNVYRRLETSKSLNVLRSMVSSKIVSSACAFAINSRYEDARHRGVDIRGEIWPSPVIQIDISLIELEKHGYTLS